MSRSTDLLGAVPAGRGGVGRIVLRGRVGGEPGSFEGYALDDLAEVVDARAGALAAEGAAPGRIHPVVVEADVPGVVTLLALWRMGAVPAPLNPRLTREEREEAVGALEGREGGGAQAVLWTSGTSGRPRGVALSREAMALHVDAVVRRLGLDPDADTWLASLPVAHVGGLMAVVRALLTGSGLLAAGPVGHGDLAALLAARGAGAVTHLSLVPTQLLRLLEAWGDAPPPEALRCVLLGGAHAPAGMLERALEAGWPVCLTYGMTEMTSQVATATPEATRAKPGSVGRPLGGVEVRIGEGGEILARGPTRALAYLDGAPLVDAEGWYHTGDLGRMDGEGDLWVTGRRVERIVTGGVNVDAMEVEEILRAHPAVADACVVGLPDETWGEMVAAVVVPVAGEFDLDEVDAWLRTRISGPKRPRAWRLAAELPLNASGKVDRARVRDLVAGG